LLIIYQVGGLYLFLKSISFLVIVHPVLSFATRYTRHNKEKSSRYTQKTSDGFA
jgi:hypothetical protein